VEAVDLEDTGRLLALFEEAVARGLVSGSERDRLRFVSAAEHARRVGTRNACGLFARMLRGDRWSYVSVESESRANARLKRHLHGQPPPAATPAGVGRGVLLGRRPAEPPCRSEPPALSPDAQLVKSIREALSRTRYQGDGFGLLRRERPDWTRERWDRASRELELWQRRRFVGDPGPGQLGSELVHPAPRSA
jgi:hypothetical protein